MPDESVTPPHANGPVPGGEGRDAMPAPEPGARPSDGPGAAHHHPEIERLLDRWRPSLGHDFDAYRGHVYRVFHCTRRLVRPGTTNDDVDDVVAVASVFHDLGIWASDTFDYLEPSAILAATYLSETQRSSWEEDVVAMITHHHTLRPYRGPGADLVEPFRRADLVDLSMGLVRFDVDGGWFRELTRRFPTAGFHRRIVTIGLGWACRHPLRPLPMVRW